MPCPCAHADEFFGQAFSPTDLRAVWRYIDEDATGQLTFIEFVNAFFPELDYDERQRQRRLLNRKQEQATQRISSSSTGAGLAEASRTSHRGPPSSPTQQTQHEQLREEQEQRREQQLLQMQRSIDEITTLLKPIVARSSVDSGVGDGGSAGGSAGGSRDASEGGGTHNAEASRAEPNGCPRPSAAVSEAAPTVDSAVRV